MDLADLAAETSTIYQKQGGAGTQISTAHT
jgi:hypothetical protein